MQHHHGLAATRLHDVNAMFARAHAITLERHHSLEPVGKGRCRASLHGGGKVVRATTSMRGRMRLCATRSASSLGESCVDLALRDTRRIAPRGDSRSRACLIEAAAAEEA